VGITIGLLLFAGFLFRPSFSAIIVPVLAYLALTGRRRFIAASATAGILFAGFLVFCFFHYGQVLPPYYLAGRLTAPAPWRAAAGLLFSPSRSILIYSPLLLLLPVALWQGVKAAAPRLWLAAGLTSMALLFTANARFPLWWASLSFGPRISVTLSALGVWLVLVCVGHTRGAARHWLLGATFALLAGGLIVNVPGITSTYTRDWNVYPHVDLYPQAVDDWRYPQFLTTSLSALRAKCAAHMPMIPAAKREACP
jgi:hypothetical protein